MSNGLQSCRWLRRSEQLFRSWIGQSNGTRQEGWLQTFPSFLIGKRLHSQNAAALQYFWQDRQAGNSGVTLSVD